MNKIVVDVIDNGAAGAELITWDRPKGCPGLGGWKNHPHGGRFTRVKGPEAERLIQFASRAPGGVITIEIDGDRIVNMSI